jgi:hypothetical protein
MRRKLRNYRAFAYKLSSLYRGKEGHVARISLAIFPLLHTHLKPIHVDSSLKRLEKYDCYG